MVDRPHDINVTLAHDWLVGMRGGEWVLDRLARLFGPTTLYTLVNDGRGLTPAIDACQVVTSPLQRFPGAAGRARRAYLPLMPWAVERLKVQPCDVLVSTSSAVMKSIRAPDGAAHLCYCHSPARYVWDQVGDYRRGSGGRLRGAGLRLIRKPFMAWDRRTASRVDQFLANSQHTARRIQACYQREAEVVYPPVRTNYFTPDPAIQREDWYLVAGALEPYKRTELVIRAARQAGIRLKVAGSGSQLNTLRGLSAPDTELLGRVSDDELRSLYRRARALIFPQEEDFGIIAVEAQACGCPVIAAPRGGALETVTEQTGVFVAEESERGLIDAMELLAVKDEAGEITADACWRNAERFGADRFDREMLQQVERLRRERG